MERQRRVSHAGLAAMALALTLAGPALAAPGSADIVVKGPVSLDGRSAMVAEGGYLLVRDPGSESYESVILQVQAESATVYEHEFQQSCSSARSATIGLVESVPARLGLSRLDQAVGTANGILQPAATPLTRTQAAVGLPLVPVVERAVAPLDLPSTQSTQARSEPPLPPLPGPLGGLTCLGGDQPRETVREQSFTNLLLTTFMTNGDYGALWRASDGEDGDRGTAILQASGLEARYVREDETVRFFGANDPWRTHDPVASEPLPGGSVRAEREGATGSLLGAGTLYLFNIEAQVTSLGGEPDDTRHYEAGQEGNGANRVLRLLEIDFHGASGSFSSPGQVLIQGPQLDATLDGTLRLRDATGEARLGERTFAFDGEPAAILGQFAFSLSPVDAKHDHEAAKGGALVLRGQGEMSSIEGAGPFEELQQTSTVTTTAAAFSLAAIAAGLAAWFWPALKWLVAPLYTRIPKDTLLMHDARERIFKLIREEPGIHAHEVAARLDLGWGTAVYHLKLLERNSLVVSRHEGRYKRFFVTGDQRIQVKDAVALLRNPTSRRIAAQVARQPGLIQKQVCEALGLSPSLASWHLQRLEAASVVRAERLGRAVRYMPGQAWLDLQEMDAALRPSMPAATLPPATEPPAPAGAA